MPQYCIWRTSDRAGNKQPCEGAEDKEISEPMPSEVGYWTWDDTGKDIPWDEEFHAWFYEIESLGDLFWLINKVGKVILHPGNDNWITVPSIEIYDSYRE